MEEGHHEIFTEVYFKAMKHRVQESLIYGLLAAVFLFCGTGPALGVILHPAGEPNLVTWTDRPDPNVVGRWSSNASCVAVSGNCVITTRHQGGGVDSSVQIGGNTYIVTEAWNHSTADLRVAKLYGANLTEFVGLYEDVNEKDKDIVIGGYGDGRGAVLVNKGKVYGYKWDNSANTTQRWGQNTVDANTSDVIIADFDGLGEGNSTTYECTIADHDSGCGWFIYDSNEWKVAGLSRAADIHYEEGHDGEHAYIEAWFRNRTNPRTLDPDYLDGVRISSYAGWISQTVPEYVPGNLTGDDYWVDFNDFAAFGQYWFDTDCGFPDWCGGADFEPDGDVDWDDLLFLMDNWLSDGQY